MLSIGHYHKLLVQEKTEEGLLLSDGINEPVLLPKQYEPSGIKIGDEMEVFLYQNSKHETEATTLKPKGVVGDLVTLKVIEIRPIGAFLDWGLPKDLFMPRGMHEDDLIEGDHCLVKILFDEQSGRLYAKEKLEDELSNEELSVKEKDVVDMIVYKNTDLGYQMIINGRHMGLLHYNEVFKDLFAGDHIKGFIKKIKPDNKIDVMIGKPGHTRVEEEADPIIQLLKSNKGFLPYHDKSDAEEIHKVFGMSKKTFKMTIGNLYRLKKIVISEKGISLVEK